MKLIGSCALSLFLAYNAVTGFSTKSRSSAFVGKINGDAARTYDTKLHISSWGKRGPPSRWKKEEVNPEEKIASYLKNPEPVAARENLDGTVLVSGWVNSKERTDQTVFDFLNNEESAFKFSKISAFVDDAKFAKKRLISRTSRYSGLLDKLEFVQAEETGALPTIEQLDGVKSWVANAGSDLELLKKIGELFKNAASIENVSILVTDANTLEAANAIEAVKSLETEGKSFTVIAVGEINEEPEGYMPYLISDFGTSDGIIPSNSTSFSRDESLRLVTECMGLASGINKAFTFAESIDVNATETKLVKGLREAGYTRPQEIDHMISKGAEAYKIAIEEYKLKVPEKTSEDEWFEMKEKELEEAAEERKIRIKKENEEKKKIEIDEISREWAKREYFRKSMSGDMPYSEDEYIKSVWDRALFEGDLKYRMLRGQNTDERKELANFKKTQEKKKAAMLEKAKASLQQLLDDDDELDKKKVPSDDE
mmetsp:Transcript_14877/g.14338  ORF Transcript_14877/g.14338 Transcript_14877/m.14338 type:complete len:483 (-) Transcript_14877:403-1851(-)|eukprot:CAMPEP_0197826054 /NCGR_PEP_ID=MMETSP1437-20131217/3056_1 /TAXON_ID=49252 ORGANISM="Eucampia antarctica, Strain CCMP1452" /NCGR_SAMPLE_ID=MMETSP1437 /ASSEMBLY_ACC=CAM_ASM_001096 /LENGTH=482 /DNA_ID=CAMNT_0043426313 /DNA_START=39 /DNA_END=1487 /DNA_ORIENTATION=-